MLEVFFCDICPETRFFREGLFCAQ
jgi:hypothetical protein